MADGSASPWEMLRGQVAALEDDLVELAHARWELAQLELKQAQAELTRLAITLGVLASPVFCGLVILLSQATHLIRQRGGDNAVYMTAAVVILTGSLFCWLCIRSFRRRFRPMFDSLEECREDLHWLREWVARKD